MFNHVHCLQDVDALSSPKYLGASYTQWLYAQGAISFHFSFYANVLLIPLLATANHLPCERGRGIPTQ